MTTTVYPYEDVSADHVVRMAHRTFRLLISGWRYYKGQPRHDMQGLAVLDEDNGVIVADGLLSSAGSALPLLAAVLTDGMTALVPLVNAAPNARFFLSPEGDLLWKERTTPTSGPIRDISPTKEFLTQ